MMFDFTMRTTIFTLCLLAVSVLPRVASAQMQYPLSVAAADSGEVFVADRNLPGVWKIESGKLTRLFEGSKKYRTPLNAVRCVVMDRAGALIAGDTATREVYRFDESGKPVPLTDGGIGMPMSVAVNNKGELLVADLELHRIWRVPAAGGKPEQVAEVQAPRGVAIDAEDNLWVVSHGQNHIVRVTPARKVETAVAGRPFSFPHNIVLAADKTAYVTDGYSKAVWKIPPGGKPEKWVSGAPLVNPVGLAWHKQNLLVADPHANAVFEITPDGKLTKVAAE
jgi:sugar lactone lactonase YvrE